MMISLSLPAKAVLGFSLALAVAWPEAARADPTPDCNAGAGARSTECGVDASTTGAGATALGADAAASADQSTAVGGLADASAAGSHAFGWDADATGELSLAVGHLAGATATRATAVGSSAHASGLHATALGTLTNAGGMGATAIGNGASAAQAGTTAVGVLSAASGNFSTAAGRRAVASGVNASAYGADSAAPFAGSSAIGFSAATTAENQVALGGAGSHVRIGDIAASTLAQDPGSLGVATVDANGVLGRDMTLRPAMAALQSQANAHGATIVTLQQDTAALFDLAETMNEEVERAHEGVAMALALETPMLPAGTRFGIAGGIGYYNEQAAGSLSVAVRAGMNAALSAGVGLGLNSGEVGARAGFQAAW